MQVLPAQRGGRMKLSNLALEIAEIVPPSARTITLVANSPGCFLWLRRNFSRKRNGGVFSDLPRLPALHSGYRGEANTKDGMSLAVVFLSIYAIALAI